MVQGRMKRESNPVPGEKPGFTPQFFDENGEPVDVTPDTPYPTGDKEVKAELQLVKQAIVNVNNRLNETLDTKISGGNIGAQTSYNPVLDETIIVTVDTVKSLSVNSNFVLCIISVENNPIRFYASGINPTADNGHLVEANGIVTLNGVLEINKFRAIGINGDAKLNISYYAIPAEPDLVAPVTPNGLAVTESYDSLSLTWDQNTDTDLYGYNVYLDGTLHNTSIITTTDYVINGLLTGTSYNIQISAIDISFNESSKTQVITVSTVAIWEDDFNRADSTNLGTSADGNIVWSEFAGNWEIQSNQLSLVTAAGSALMSVATFATGNENGTLKATFVNNLLDSRLGLRLTNDNPVYGYLFVRKDTQYNLYTTNPVNTVVGTRLNAVTPQAGDVIKVVLNGVFIDCYVNDIHVISHEITDGYHVDASGGTKYSIASYGTGTGNIYDNVSWANGITGG